jgi:8-oxo-dGTP pyrophosphatase MutT (NUDIX family)
LNRSIPHLSHRLEKHKPKHLPLEGFTSSAVLVPIVYGDARWNVLYTRRTHRVRDHKNQISFPGGVREKRDNSLIETALRETEEEIGLDPEAVKVLGRLRDLYTPTGYRITPVVGLICDRPRLKPNPDEIDEIFQVPLSHLMDKKNMKLQKAEFFGKAFDLPFFNFRHYIIWGATGRITRDFIELCSPR